MKSKMSREELIVLVTKICNFEGTQEEVNDNLGIFIDNVPHPTPGDIIFYNSEQLSPEEIVDIALNYKETK